MKSFPTLFKKNAKGKIQTWDISVANHSTESGPQGVITILYGQQGGKIQTTTDTIKEGKNLGKVNETTPYDQACLEAESKWTAQQARDSYVLNIEQAGEDLREGDEPMLAQRFDKYPEKMPFPCAIQPKLDGHRCVAIIKDGQCTLYSRTRTLITGVPHINAELARAFGHLELTLDGELYNHDYKAKFEELTSFIRSQEPKEGHKVVQYHVYDLVDLDGTFRERNEYLQEVLGTLPKSGPVKLVATRIVEESEVVSGFKNFLLEGYEGAMLRNLDSKYEQRRSYGLMKVKEFEDAEFKIIGVKEGRGKLQGHAIFTCTVDGTEDFDVKLKGKEETLKEIFQNQPQYIGQLLTVQFQGRTKNNIPRFPVGVRLRQDA
jgi:DNA ligase-1